MKSTIHALLFICSLAVFSVANANDENTHKSSTDEAAIRKVLLNTWDKPEASLLVEPVVINDEYAIAGWTQGERGGRALLIKQQAEWQVMLCSGDGITEAAQLQQAGIPLTKARQLAAELALAEQKLPPATRKKMSQFGQTKNMGDGHIEAHSLNH